MAGKAGEWEYSYSEMSRVYCKSTRILNAIGLFLDLSGRCEHQGTSFTFTANGAKRLAIETHVNTTGVSGSYNDLLAGPDESLLVGAQCSMTHATAVSNNRDPGIFLGFDDDEEVFFVENGLGKG